MYDVSRIEALRLSALEPHIDYTPFYYHFQKSYIARHWEGSGAMRYAHALTDAFENWDLSIDQGELIVGKPSPNPLTPEQAAEWQTISAYAVAEMHAPVGQESHMAVDYDRLMTLGTTGVRVMIEEKIAALNTKENGDGNPDLVKKEDWYRACQVCLSAVERFSERYADYAGFLAETEENPIRREELTKIAEICRHVPKNPPRNFWEAVQSTAFLTLCLSVKPLRPSMLQYQLGRPDRYLLPFYESDRAAGTLTDDFAQTLIDCLCIQINRRVPHGLSSGFMVGGRDASGNVVSNPITRMGIRAIEQVRLVYPSVGLCMTSDTPAEDLQLACSVLRKGHSHPAIFNDDVITAGLRHYGLSVEEACSYIHSTCVEITPCAMSNVWVASPYMNLPGELLAVLEKADYPTMDDLYTAYRTHIAEGIRSNCRTETLYRYERAKFCLDPLLSCFVHDCLENGVDIEEGGARVNWIMPSFVGLANAADGLAALEKLVYRENMLTLAEYRVALHENFQNHPALLARLQSLSAYGNNEPEKGNPEWYVTDLSTVIADTCDRHKVPFSGGRLIPSLFCWIMHDHFGRNTGATPDGRPAGFPLGDGSGPAQGREMEGPTTSLLSSTCWDHTRFIGGIAVNMKFSTSLLGEDGADTLAMLARIYLERGGFELQINVTDNRILEDARKHPEQYKDLVVRIGGYSDYFTRLSPTMQDEVIQRTVHTGV